MIALDDLESIGTIAMIHVMTMDEFKHIFRTSCHQKALTWLM